MGVISILVTKKYQFITNLIFPGFISECNMYLFVFLWEKMRFTEASLVGELLIIVEESRTGYSHGFDDILLL